MYNTHKINGGKSTFHVLHFYIYALLVFLIARRYGLFFCSETLFFSFAAAQRIILVNLRTVQVNYNQLNNTQLGCEDCTCQNLNLGKSRASNRVDIQINTKERKRNQ
jgi:hypothetical protein